ncbi:MAG: lysozyme inhibitor LprI family protein [Cyanobacteria bacterium P01_H01_bin.58]
MRKIFLGLMLSCCVGAIAACQNSTETAETVTPESDTAAEQTAADTTEPTSETEAAEPDTSDTTASTATESKPTAAANQTTASAEAKPVPPLPAECSNPQDQSAMTQCAKAEYERADVQLNNAYQSVQATLSGPKANELVTAENAWITFRDSYCDFVKAQFAGGSIEPMVHFGCLTQLTKSRTSELQQTKSASMSFEAADQELNAVYQDLQSYLAPADQDLLIDAQLAWLEYRDAHCAFETGNLNTCLAQVTETQVEELKQQLDTRSL